MIKYTQIFNKIKYQKTMNRCLSVISLDSILVNSDKEYYPQIFLEECRYMIWNRKILNAINEDLGLSESNDESDD